MNKAIFALLLTLGSAALAEPPGSSDHPLVGRYAGASMKNFVKKEYEETRILTRPVVSSDNGVKNERNSVAIAGKWWRISYAGPEGRSPLEVVKNYEASLQGKQFEQKFICRGPECGPGYGSQFWKAATAGGNASLSTNWETQVYAAFERATAEGVVWVAVLAVESKRMGFVEPQVMVDIVEAAPLEGGKITVVSASEMATSIEDLGKASIYGIEFDNDSTTIMPSSTPALDEVAKFLRNNPAITLIVTGHTDSVGGFDYNVDLSRRRAAAVITALGQRYGIGTDRLTPFGAGMAAPVASNATEEGRAKNRRVELVKR